MHRKIYQKNYRASRSSQEYTGTFYIGATTPSYDLETEIDQTFPVAHITEALIHETVKQFFREIDQVPPIFGD
jgi:tRNA pseudouridine55 synthase